MACPIPQGGHNNGGYKMISFLIALIAAINYFLIAQ